MHNRNELSGTYRRIDYQTYRLPDAQTTRMQDVTEQLTAQTPKKLPQKTTR